MYTLHTKAGWCSAQPMSHLELDNTQTATVYGKQVHAKRTSYASSQLRCQVLLPAALEREALDFEHVHKANMLADDGTYHWPHGHLSTYVCCGLQNLECGETLSAHFVEDRTSLNISQS